ncbi:hypothetical protein C8R45DRAFT_946099 [Mycena sanguinolenta]|nr:hypothetical protein C8R45DRAFT_946099 [Mycena sanguinolenta]
MANLASVTAVHLSTSRVPFFEKHWQATSYSFRFLQKLIPAAAGLMLPASDLNCPIFAVDATHPKTAEYMWVWEVLGLKPETHFILILHTPPIPATIHFRLDSTNLNLPAPLRLSSPAPSLASTHRSPLGSSFSQQSQPASEYSYSPISEIPLANFGDQLLPDTTFPVACSLVGLTEADIQRATRQSDAKQLVPMVQNWSAAAHVLAKLCLSDNTSSYRFSGGLVVTLEGVLVCELSWGSVKTFTNKSGWYHWAAEAATLFWPSSSVPSMTLCKQDSDYDLYMTWQAICFIWQAGGPLQTGILPQKSSTNPVEQHATALTQSMIAKFKSKLTQKLVHSRYL